MINNQLFAKKPPPTPSKGKVRESGVCVFKGVKIA